MAEHLGRLIGRLNLAVADPGASRAFCPAPAGGRDDGAPDLRRCHTGHDAAFAIDPHGNPVEALLHGDRGRSASPVVAGRA